MPYVGIDGLGHWWATLPQPRTLSVTGTQPTLSPCYHCTHLQHYEYGRSTLKLKHHMRTLNVHNPVGKIAHIVLEQKQRWACNALSFIPLDIFAKTELRARARRKLPRFRQY